MDERLIAVGICGFSGAGKTSLIVDLVCRLSARGLRAAVVKHDVHGVRLDTAGKDSDRVFTTGADVVLMAPEQTCARLHPSPDGHLRAALASLAGRCDIVLVEGCKSDTQLPKIWLRRHAGDRPPPRVTGVILDLRRDQDRAAIAMERLGPWLHSAWRTTPVHAGILIGGRSTRMGRPKHLIRRGELTWIERIARATAPRVRDVVLIGRGDVPASLRQAIRLPDVPERQGPIAGMLSAMRWQPQASWLFLSCDLPFVSTDAIDWLLSTRAPGVWATIPKVQGHSEPLLAHYDWRARRLLEECRGPAGIAGMEHVITPSPAAHLADAWRNVNTPADWKRARSAPVGPAS